MMLARYTSTVLGLIPRASAIDLFCLHAASPLSTSSSRGDRGARRSSARLDRDSAFPGHASDASASSTEALSAADSIGFSRKLVAPARKACPAKDVIESCRE